jgi:NADPH2:quinone reductase
MTDTMRAWIVREYGQPLDVLQLEEVEVPVPEPGEVLVRVLAIPLNVNDLERITGGNMMAPPEFPYSPGMETMGIVEACGEGTEAWMGKRVVATTKRAHGGFAEKVLCDTNAVFDMPDDIELPGAAALYFPFHLAWLGLHDRADLQAGESVLIHAAAGGSGSAAIQLAKAAGARVFATAGTDDKVQLCRDLGADVAINYTTENFAEIVLAETNNRGVEVVFDNVGEAVWADSVKATAYNGRYLMMGFASNKVVADEPFVVPRQIAFANIKLCGVMLNYASDEMVGTMKSFMGWNVSPSELGSQITANIVDLVRAGTVRPVIGTVADFDDLPTIITAMGNRETVGRLIVNVPAS